MTAVKDLFGELKFYHLGRRSDPIIEKGDPPSRCGVCSDDKLVCKVMGEDATRLG